MPTRFGNMAAQMRNFLDQAGGLWVKGSLVGKGGSVFASSATQHGGNETTIITTIPTLLHLGFVVVGLPYACQAQMGLDEIKGGSPYGATTITGRSARSCRAQSRSSWPGSSALPWMPTSTTDQLLLRTWSRATKPCAAVTCIPSNASRPSRCR